MHLQCCTSRYWSLRSISPLWTKIFMTPVKLTREIGSDRTTLKHPIKLERGQPLWRDTKRIWWRRPPRNHTRCGMYLACSISCLLLYTGSSSHRMLFDLLHWRPCPQQLVSERWRFFNLLPAVIVKPQHSIFALFEEQRRKKTNKKPALHCVVALLRACV